MMKRSRAIEGVIVSCEPRVWKSNVYSWLISCGVPGIHSGKLATVGIPNYKERKECTASLSAADASRSE